MHLAGHTKRDIILFSAPFLLVYVVFLAFPVVYGIYLSFFDWNILSGKAFVGLRNFVQAFSDEKFKSSFFHTLQFVGLSTPILIVTGFLMALISVRPTKLGKAAESIFFLPYMFSTTVVGTLWAWLLQKNYGLVNQLLQAIGLQGVGWLTDPNVAMLSIVLATLWWTAGFNMILFSAGMKQIPDEIYESARLDGAGKLVTLTRITIPLLKDTTLLVVILQIIASFKVFGQVYVMTGGGPYGTTRVLVQYVYEMGFNYFKLGYASAMSMVLFVVILVISAAQLLASKDDVQ
ncbi:MAG: carbohydrate ABC transporter permease [Rectinema subterraneum]|uniref:carbohydrate ABC transporter permease n=1 Tax=Rectinema subterraneum TaxID=2653714 RepID=UPI003C7DCF09